VCRPPDGDQMQATLSSSSYFRIGRPAAVLSRVRVGLIGWFTMLLVLLVVTGLIGTGWLHLPRR
jgi:hypothetical protein